MYLGSCENIGVVDKLCYCRDLCRIGVHMPHMYPDSAGLSDKISKRLPHQMRWVPSGQSYMRLGK